MASHQQGDTSSTDETAWIECDQLVDHDHEEAPALELADLFQDPEPMETFSLEWSVPKTTDGAQSEGADKEVEEETIRIVLTGYKAELGQTLSSTGLTLWPAARLLCDYMVSNHDHIQTAQSILELGAGLGLCGMLASKLGAPNVVMTDGDSDTLAQMRSNVRANFFGHDASSPSLLPPECHQLIWKEPQDGAQIILAASHGRNKHDNHKKGGFSLVLGADICYMESTLGDLWSIVAQLLAHEADSQFWLSYTVRNVSIDRVLAAARRHGFVCRHSPAQKEGVYVFGRNDDNRDEVVSG